MTKVAFELSNEIFSFSENCLILEMISISQISIKDMNSTLLYIHFNVSSIMSILLPVVGVYVINY